MGSTPEERRSRYRFDWEICQRMNEQVFHAEAFRSTPDLERQHNPISAASEAHLATKWRVDFWVPTLVGPGRFAESTVIGFDLSTGDYPYREPATWIISPHVPYSPHFKQGRPVCIGEIWRDADGRMLLSTLFVHIARLLNWDEVARGGGYVGWNAEAIAYHRSHYGGRPLNPSLRYPTTPADLTHGLVLPELDLFAASGQTVSPSADDLFSTSS